MFSALPSLKTRKVTNFLEKFAAATPVIINELSRQTGAEHPRGFGNVTCRRGMNLKADMRMDLT